MSVAWWRWASVVGVGWEGKIALKWEGEFVPRHPPFHKFRGREPHFPPHN
jgi:hypothetical protein